MTSEKPTDVKGKDMNKENRNKNMKKKEDMKIPKVVSSQEWKSAREKLLVKEKKLTRARDALAAERRRMPWMAVKKEYKFDGPNGKVSLLDLFDGRHQLIVYRAFFERSGDKRESAKNKK